MTACEDRQRGTLLGLAIGDTLGAAVEFKSPGTFPEVTGYRGGGPHGLAPGQWTDDTSMALALAEPPDVLDVLMRLRQQNRERRHRMSPETAAHQRFVKA